MVLLGIGGFSFIVYVVLLELSRRRDNVPWALHRDVAPLLADQQDVLLTQADAQGWTQREMRDAVRRSKRGARAQSEHNRAVAGVTIACWVRDRWSGKLVWGLQLTG